MREDGALASFGVKEDDGAAGGAAFGSEIATIDVLAVKAGENGFACGVMSNGAKENTLVSVAGKGGGGVQRAAANAITQVVDVDLGADGEFGKDGLAGNFDAGKVVAVDEDDILEDAAEGNDARH